MIDTEEKCLSIIQTSLACSGCSFSAGVNHVVCYLQTAKDSKDQQQQSKKRKHQPDSDDEYAAADDSEDEFYDRTVAAGPTKTAAGKDKAAAKRTKGEPAKVENAETLYAKR